MKHNKKLLIVLSAIISLGLAYFVQATGLIDSDVASKVDKKTKDAIVLFVGSPAAYVDNIKMQIENDDQEIYPIIKNDRTIVPIRFISEKLGANVVWNEIGRTAVLSLNGKEIRLTLDSNIMKVDGKDIMLEAGPIIKNGRMFIPLRAISEAFDKKVFWNDGLIIISDTENIIDIDSEKEILDEIVSRVNILPTVNSLENLKLLLQKSQENNPNQYYARNNMMFDGVMMESAMEKSAAPTANSKDESLDFSSTNVQVEGVDEADIVKNDGEYIYHIKDGKVNIVKAYPADEMKNVTSITFDKMNFSPSEMYVDKNILVVIGNSYNDIKTISNDSEVLDKRMAMPIYNYQTNTTKAIIYDISNIDKIKQKREVEIDGTYVSSRKIDSTLYLVSNKNIGYYGYNESEYLTPAYKDTVFSDEYVNVNYKDIKYLPNFIEPNYLIVAGINVENNEKADISTYLGTGNNVYSSKDNMYIATNNYKYEGTKTEEVLYKGREAVAGEKLMNDISLYSYSEEVPVYTQNTLVYKLGLDSGKVSYKGKGEVPGTILNQFSMDESNGNFRIATTTQDQGWNNGSTSKNNVYILDKNMLIVGQLEDLAPGEKIYSVRFIGDRGYIVTFKTVDPLFVIDLKDPTSPKVLGELKIPGFSDYLHPYDENHIIGFGNDTMEVPVKDENGRIIETRAITTGMKLAIFDVSDVTNPIQKYVEKIGGRGTYSELLQNHKALLFSKNRNLLAFPVSVAEEIKDSDGIPQYGQAIFKGAYVYNIDLESGFELKGKISHFEDANNGYYYNYQGEIQRIIYIGNNLYTISQSMIKANDIETISEIGSIKNN